MFVEHYRCYFVKNRGESIYIFLLLNEGEKLLKPPVFELVARAVHWTVPFRLVRFPSLPLTNKLSHPYGWLNLLKTNPNFDTNAPPFEVRGCKVILGGAFFIQGGANRVLGGANFITSTLP